MFGYKRLDAIFETICNAEYTPAERLSTLFGVTARTIRSDITKINSHLEPHGAHIAMKREAGYYLVVDNRDAFQAFQEQENLERSYTPDLSSADERIRFLLRVLLNATAGLTYDVLADMVYVGENTLQNYIRQIRDILSDYDLALVARPGSGLRILGREHDRRRCFMDKVVVRDMRSYVTGFSKEEQAMFAGIDLTLLEDIVRRHLNRREIVSSDYGFKNLLMHAALMIVRIHEQCEIEMVGTVDMTPRIQLFIDDTCSDLERAFKITIPEAERRYLYLHILSNTTLNGPDINEHLIRNDIDEMLDLVWRNYGFDLRDDAELKNNLMEHLIATFRSKDLKLSRRNPLLNTIRTNFPLAFEIALASTLKVFDTEPHTLSEDEVGYVALHIGAAIERKSPKGVKPLRIILICGAGKSIIEMLRSRIDALFGDKLEIMSTLSYRQFTELDTSQLGQADFVVTTVPLEDCPLPNVLVDFSLNTQDTESISRLMNTVGGERQSKISQFFDDQLFIRMSGRQTKGTVLETLCQLLEDVHVVSDDFIASVMEREALSDTSMSPNFAIPHSMKPISFKTRVAVAVLDESALWNDGSPDVRIVFLLAIRAGDRENIEHLYDLLLEIANNRHLQQEILDARNFASFMDTLNIEGV